ncbi:2Fe-2S iron-sulfur cluster-binding protein [Aurantiacibacter rhizosphaerae]|uniref:2Fe-2S iron-sulfur cluster binding domain-containing protein n=1 Tax=Aurantiacibacter rhizosphaerae TaxID=2691582 RepID=A0A844XCN2_9SPHN|nr:2Fe-2S iron-sulfur cluster binding domain-containing protein [Aurantiacibacter rhizosphaerae]
MKVTFITRKNEKVEVQAAAGDRLLEVGQAAGMPLEGTCEGQMACSTCHVIIAREWFDKLEPAVEDEEDMLDLAADVQATSRLSCQIILSEELDGMEVRMPSDSNDAQGF